MNIWEGRKGRDRGREGRGGIEGGRREGEGERWRKKVEKRGGGTSAIYYF